MYDHIVIVGCGNLGSYLAYTLSLRNLEDKTFEKLILIDKDIIEEKNLPYIYQSLNNRINKYIGYPKVNLLKYLLHQLDKKLKIIIHYNDFKNIEELKELAMNKKNLFIDARDTANESSLFKLKIQTEGAFGRIIINPHDSKDSKDVIYIMEISRFLASYFSHLIISNYIIRMDTYPRKKRYNILINLCSGRSYNLYGQQTSSITVV